MSPHKRICKYMYIDMANVSRYVCACYMNMLSVCNI